MRTEDLTRDEALEPNFEVLLYTYGRSVRSLKFPEVPYSSEITTPVLCSWAALVKPLKVQISYPLEDRIRSVIIRLCSLCKLRGYIAQLILHELCWIQENSGSPGRPSLPWSMHRSKSPVQMHKRAHQLSLNRTEEQVSISRR